MKRMKIQLAVKRGFDIVVSIFLLLVFLPVWILVRSEERRVGKECKRPWGARRGRDLI